MTPLEQYFDTLQSVSDDTLVSIRVAGTRVGIEHILREYLQGASPEELALRFPTLSLEQIHATITFYLAQNELVSRYLRNVWEKQQVDAIADSQTSSTFVKNLRQRLEARRQDLLVGQTVP